MYQMLSTSAFRLPSNPGPQAIYYGARTPILDVNGDPELDATGNPTYVPVPALDRATQASPNLTGWNPSMEIIKIMEQMTTTYGRPTPTALLQNDMLF